LSYQQIVTMTPVGNFGVAPLSEALRELEAGKREQEPMRASGHFVECARLAGQKALAGEHGALALYNHSVARVVECLEKAGKLPWEGSIAIGEGATSRTLLGKLEPGAPPQKREYLPVDELSFRGKYAGGNATREGVGAPVVAVSASSSDFRQRYAPAHVYAGLTAVLRFDAPGTATLELHDPLDEERIDIAGRHPVLAADFCSATSLGMARLRPDKLGLARMLNPQKYSDTARLVRLQKYDKHRIPVLFIHGLQDTPASWLPMYHGLLQDPELRARYQFWVFSYPSGYPYPYSASLLRKELDGVRKAFPDHKDIVLVGHSMGGILSRMMVTDAQDKIWRSMFGKSPEETHVVGASRQLLLDSMVFSNRPDVKRAIFIAAPHRGSTLASNWIGRTGSRLVRLPGFITDARNSVASVLTADAASLQLDRAPNSIDTLAPNNRFVRETNKLPIAPGVTYHSIIGDRGRGDTPDSSDGVVPYWSSHLEGAGSEKIVPSNHSAHQNPEAITEVRRILKLHLNRNP
jgi:pimeloyl-ACP methyl ester carboxylesterase